MSIVYGVHVSRGIPAAMLGTERMYVPSAFVGTARELEKKYPLSDFPNLVGVGHRVESPNREDPEVFYLTLWIRESGKWVPAKDDPRVGEKTLG